MKQLFYISITIFLLFACKNTTLKEEIEPQVLIGQSDEIPLNPLTDMSLWNEANVNSRMKWFPQEFQLDEVDNQYREVVAANSDHSGLEAFRSQGIPMIVNTYSLPENGSKEMIQYYLDEINNCEFVKLNEEELKLIRAHRERFPNVDISSYLNNSINRLNSSIEELDLAMNDYSDRLSDEQKTELNSAKEYLRKLISEVKTYSTEIGK